MYSPTYLREGLQDFLDSDHDDFVVETADGDQDINWLLGQLWHSTDILPVGYCDHLEIPQGSTYARAVRRIRERPDLFLVAGKAVAS